MKHFLQWGVAVSFGMYTYLSYLPFIPLFIFTVFIWVWFQKEGRNMENPIGPVVWTTVSVFFFFFLYNNNGFSRDSWIARTIDVSGPFLPCMVLGCLGLLTVIALPKLAGEEKSSKWFGWIAGSWVCLVLSFPVMTNEQITARVNNFSFAQGPGSFVLESIQRIKTVFMLLFWQNTGDCTNALPGDSYFGYGEVIIIALGLAFFFARLNWKSCLLFIAALVGFLPNAFLLQPHTGRILGCVVPFLLLGSLGLNEVLNSLFFLSKGRVISRLACLLLLGLWGWSAQASLSRIFDQWSEKILSKHVLASQEAYKDASLGYRIYFVSSLFNANAYPLNEGNKIHLWLCPNLINLTPNDKPEDVDLILEPDSRGDNNQLLKDQLAKDFPTAHWKDLHTPNQNPGDGPTLISCVIPFSDISAYSQKYAEVQAKSLKLSKKPSASTPLLVPPLAYFEVRQTPMPCWDRQYSTGYFGLAFDLISYEDKATNAQDPGPKTENGGAVRCEGIIHVDGGGNYEMNWKTVNRTEIQIDGRTLLNVYFPQTNNFISPEKGGMKTIRLDPGDHQVKVTTCFQQNCNLPDISLNPVGQSGSGQSLWSSYKF
jgi:hypothetical protein